MPDPSPAPARPDPTAGTALAALETPVFVVDADRLAANVRAMESRCAALGVAFRPHLKTAKSVDVAARIPAARDHGITVSTVKEAEHFAAAGYTDQLLAVGAVPERLARLVPWLARGATIRLAVDDPATAADLGAAARQAGVAVEVLVEVDCGEHRAGRDPEDPALVATAARLHEQDGTRLGGVFTHGGHSYVAADLAGVRAVAEAERAAIVAAAEALDAAGLPCPIRSVGSTPTLTHATSLAGVTEARAGVFVFQDAFQVGLGSCSLDAVAGTVLTTIFAHHRRPDRLLIDAGGLALSKDRSTAAFGDGRDVGYGLLLDVEGRVLPGLRVVQAYQEHGVVQAVDGNAPDLASLPVGSRLRVVPNHACMTASAFDRYVVVRGTAVEAVWPRIHEWR